VDKYRDLGLLILRLGFGLSFVWYHGLPKLVGGPKTWTAIGDAVSHLGITAGYPVWGLMAALTESVGGLLFAAGLFFRPTCLALLGVMIMATIEQSTRADPMPEHALKNAFVLAGMLLVGPGRYSAAAVFTRRKRMRNR
jgi:putative oxidoreductase